MRRCRSVERRLGAAIVWFSAPLHLCVIFLLLVSPARAQIVDRMLATVNGELITESEICWELALDPDLQPLDLSAENKRLMLERVIDQRILRQEAAKIPQNPPTDEQIREYRQKELIERFGSQEALLKRTRAVGLDPPTVREIISRRILLLKYIDFRFRSFILVQPDEVERYYREVALPRMRNRGGLVRTLDEMRAEIGNNLGEEKINAELDRFLDEARNQAQIVRLAELK
ncbi:MAG: hypothetical protein ABI882_20285 [Acidobacteriota bacterium]